MLKMLTVEKLHVKSLAAAGRAMNTTVCLNAIMWMNQKRQKSIEGACLVVMTPEQTNYPLLSTSFLNKVNTLSNKVSKCTDYMTIVYSIVARVRQYVYVDCVMDSV